jgi:hypothetical protein
MDVDDRLRFTIDITHQSIYWSGGPTAEALSVPDLCARQLAVGTGTRRP